MGRCEIFKALDTLGPQPTHTTPKDQSILTTAPKALLVDDQFVDLCCSHLVLLFSPSAVPSLQERSHLDSLPLKQTKGVSDFFLQLLFDIKLLKILVLLSWEVAPTLAWNHSSKDKDGWRKKIEPKNLGTKENSRQALVQPPRRHSITLPKGKLVVDGGTHYLASVYINKTQIIKIS